jgi:regulator of protease activity HflC (stomatin/prohibitin superfamily)
MERIPFSRRTGLIALASLATCAIVYAVLFYRADETGLQGPFFTLIWILGVIALLGLFALSLEILRYGATSTGQWMGMMIRFVLLAAWLAMHLVFFSAPEQNTRYRTILTDLDLGLLVTLAMIAITAQFVLPVEKPTDRFATIRRLLGHALGERGPVMYIHEGQAIEAHGESERVGPGVFLVDHASAVVFRTDTAFTRAAGPGVIFTRPGERLAEALDLRRQERRASEGLALHADQALEEAQSNRSRAITRDGIPISAEITVEFMLDPGHEAEPREGRNPEKPPYEFHRPSVERAVYGHVFSEFEDVPWTELPLKVVIDLWREEVKRWSLNDLLEHDGRANALEKIEAVILSKIRTSTHADDDTPDEASVNREASIVQSRGIRILDIHLRSLHVPPEIQAERQLQWREHWSGAVQDALNDATEEVERYRHQGRQEADQILLQKLTSSINDLLVSGQHPSRRDTLNLLLADAIRMLNDEDLNPESRALASKLQAIVDRLNGMDANCREPEH